MAHRSDQGPEEPEEPRAHSPDLLPPDMGNRPDEKRTIILMGKSSSVQFGHENALIGETQQNLNNLLRISPLRRKISNHPVSVINMMDLHESDRGDHLVAQVMKENQIQAFVLAVRSGQLTDSLTGLDWLQRQFGDGVLRFVIILFTYETKQESRTIVDDLKKNPVLEKILEKCGGGYQACNKKMNDQSEMRDLMKKIEDLCKENQEQRYTGEMFNTAARTRKEREIQRHIHHLLLGHMLEIDPNENLNFVLLGSSQAGKSASGNTILGRDAFELKKKSKPSTRDVAVESGDVNGFPVTVYDTPGVSEMSEEEIQQIISEVLQKCGSGPCVFLLVIRTGRFTKEDQESVEKIEKIEKILGEQRLEKTWILFTGGDDLEEENMTIQEFIKDNDQLKTLVQKYEQRYHVFNNSTTGSSDQTRLLLVKTLQRIYLTDGDRDEQWTEGSLFSRRILLMGNSDVWKGVVENTILGRTEFSCSSMICRSTEAQARVSGRSVSVFNTPELLNTQMRSEDLAKEIGRSVYMSSPGAHAFFIVIPVDKFTKKDQQIPQRIKKVFGEDVFKYSVILFTHGDQQEDRSVEEIIEENKALRDLVQQCGYRYNVFNNENDNNSDQVNDLLQKIDLITERNGGEHFSNEMYEDAERLRQRGADFEDFYFKHKELFLPVFVDGPYIVAPIVAGVVGATVFTLAAVGGAPVVAAGAAACYAGAIVAGAARLFGRTSRRETGERVDDAVVGAAAKDDQKKKLQKKK